MEPPALYPISAEIEPVGSQAEAPYPEAPALEAADDSVPVVPEDADVPVFCVLHAVSPSIKVNARHNAITFFISCSPFKYFSFYAFFSANSAAARTASMYALIPPPMMTAEAVMAV